MGVWVLGAEVFAFDVGRSAQHEPEPDGSAGAGGQFELGFQGGDVEADSTDFGFRAERR
jgi:hypothetical protein